MKIGILDTDGDFTDDFFKNRNIKIYRNKPKESAAKNDSSYTHAEYVCSQILNENPYAEILLIPIMKSNKKCSVIEMIRGIERLIDEDVDMINLSIGDEYNYHRELEDVCKKAWEKNILMIAAHSNHEAAVTYPASFPFVLGVRCVESGQPANVLEFDIQTNEVVFSSKYFSIYHLGIPKLIPGNSFACAKITGFISCFHIKYADIFDKFITSTFNFYYPYKLLKNKKCLFLTNRINDPLEQEFIREITNTTVCRLFDISIFDELRRNHIDRKNYEIIFLDHNNYLEISPYKENLTNYILTESQVEIVLRYPLYSLSERLYAYINKQKAIQQFML